MSRENSLWKWLSGARKILGPDLHINRVENAVMKGMPDVEGHCLSGVQFWVELKSSERPKRATTPIRFKVKDREAQAEWLRKRCRVGGLAWLCLQVGSGADRRIYLVFGEHAELVYSGVTEAELAQLDTLKMLKPKPADIIRCASAKPYSDPFLGQ